MRGIGLDSVSDHRFIAYGAGEKVWNGATFVDWDENDVDDYLIDATRQAGTKTYTADAPNGATSFELYYWTGDLATSLLTYEDDIESSITNEAGEPQPQTRDLKVRLTRPSDGSFFDPVGNVVELISPDGTYGARRVTGGAIVVPASPLQTYTRAGVGIYNFPITENGYIIQHGYRYVDPISGATERDTNISHPEAAAEAEPADPTTIAEALQQDAIDGIKRASGDQGSFEKMSVDERIAADRYVNSKAASKKGLGIRLVKLLPGGQD